MRYKRSGFGALLLATASVSCTPQALAADGNSASGDQGNSRVLAQVTINASPGRLIPSSFMGIAHEWGDAQTIMGDSGSGTNIAYRNLLSNLTAYGSGPIVIRVGGNSTDTSKEPTANTVRPFAELAAATGAHFYLGINLGADNMQLALDQARAFLSGMPAHSIDALEIGNEPDSYVDKDIRRAPYPFAAYLSDFDNWRRQIYPILPAGTSLLGPTWAYTASLSNAAPFLLAEHAYLDMLSQHYYATDACKGHVAPADALLKPKSSTSAASQMLPAISLAHGYHVGFRVDELNSIACGGQDGLSNSFGAALWAVDIMFELANAGVDGINWQSPNGALYSPLNFSIAHIGNHASYGIKTVSPLYYGMLFFQAATGKQAHLLPVTVSSSPNLKAWATIDGTGKIRLVLINRDTASSGLVGIRLPGFGTASILRLVAPDVTSRQGLTFAGQTVDGSADGTLRGKKQVENIKPIDGTFQIPLTAGSALIAEFASANN